MTAKANTTHSGSMRMPNSNATTMKNGSTRTGMPKILKCALATEGSVGAAGLGDVIGGPYDADPMPRTPALDALPQGDEKVRAVRDMFDAIAPRYDLVNRVMTLRMDVRWRRRAVHSLALQAGSADGVTCGFALRNLVALPPFLAELARVLRAGGRIALLEVATPPNRLMRWGPGVYFRRGVPRPAGRVRAPLWAGARRLDADVVLLAFAGRDGVLFERGRAGLAGRGCAARIPWPGEDGDPASAATRVSQALAPVEVDDQVGLPGCGAVAFGALPFAASAPSELVVPAVLAGRSEDGARWLTTIDRREGGTDRPPPPLAAPDERLPPVRRFMVAAQRHPDDWCDLVER